MQRVNASFLLTPLFVASIALAWPTPAQAQSPAPVTVRLVDGVDSSKDPGGKQYRASVTKAVDAGNGVVIPQGAAAAVTLVNSASGWTTQLVSVTVNGQPVAVTTGPASVTSAAQSAASAAVSSMNSVLGGFGRHVNAPAAATAVATGQRVVLPPGVALSFVLSEPPSANQTAAGPSPQSSPAAAGNSKECAFHATCAASSPQTMAANATPTAAASSATGPGTWYRCNARGSTASQMVVYATPYFHTDAKVTTVEQAWTKYVRLTYPMDKLVAEAEQCEQFGNSAEQRAFAMDYEDKGWTGSHAQLNHVDWTYTPAEIAATNAAAASAQSALAAQGLAAAPNQHYVYCLSGGAGSAQYFSEIFAAVPTSAVQGPHAGRNGFPEFSGPFIAFLQQKYGFKETPSSPTTCRAIYNPNAAGLHAAQATKQAAEDLARQNKMQVVETGWKQ